MKNTFLTTIILFAILSSCRKNNFDQKLNSLELRSFFINTEQLSPSVKRVHDYLELMNKESPFVNDFVKNFGYPLWQKSVVPERTAKRQPDGLVGEDTLVVIPIEISNQRLITKFIVANINNEITMKLFQGADFNKYDNNYNNSDTLNQRKVLEQIIWLNYKVYGYTNFKVFNDYVFNGENGESIVKVDEGSDLFQLERVSIATATICTTRPNPEGCSCPEHNLQTCTCAIPDCCWITECSTIYFSDYSTGSGSSGGGTSGSGSSGGGTSGSGINSNQSLFPCPSLQGRSAPYIGCGSNNQTILVPIEIESDDYNPFRADTVIIAPDLIQQYPCLLQIIDTLARYGNLNQRAQIALSTIFGVNKYMHIQIRIDSTLILSGNNATTTAGIGNGIPPDDLDFSTSINLNPDMLQNASKHFVAAIITHEAMHAYIDYVFTLYQNGYLDSTQVKSQFPLFWYYGNGYYMSPTNQHKLMATNWINEIKSALYAFDSTSIGNLSISADSIFSSFAWAGLEKTGVFSENVNKCDIRAIQIVGRDINIVNPYVPNLPVGQTPCNSQYNLTANQLGLNKRICD